MLGTLDGESLGALDGPDEELGVSLGCNEGRKLGATLALGVSLGWNDGKKLGSLLVVGEMLGWRLGEVLGSLLGIELGSGLDGTSDTTVNVIVMADPANPGPIAARVRCGDNRVNTWYTKHVDFPVVAIYVASQRVGLNVFRTEIVFNAAVSTAKPELNRANRRASSSSNFGANTECVSDNLQDDRIAVCQGPNIHISAGINQFKSCHENACWGLEVLASLERENGCRLP